MKIVIPTDDKKGLEDMVAKHFGRCFNYTFLNENGEIIEIIKNESEDMGGKGLPPELIKKHGANILLCNDIGPKALILSEKLGIKVYIGKAGKVKDIFKKWKIGELKEAK